MNDTCQATYDISPDGLLTCTREPGHPGIHRGLVWWLELPELERIELGA